MLLERLRLRSDEPRESASSGKCTQPVWERSRDSRRGAHRRKPGGSWPAAGTPADIRRCTRGLVVSTECAFQPI